MEKPRKSFLEQERLVFYRQIPFQYTSTCRQTLAPILRHDFTSNYRERLATEWSPQVRAKRTVPLIIQPKMIHFASMGQLPNYTGFIPGSKYRFGKTYGNDTKDVKKWFRENGVA